MTLLNCSVPNLQHEENRDHCQLQYNQQQYSVLVKYFVVYSYKIGYWYFHLVPIKARTDQQLKNLISDLQDSILSSVIPVLWCCAAIVKQGTLSKLCKALFTFPTHDLALSNGWLYTQKNPMCSNLHSHPHLHICKYVHLLWLRGGIKLWQALESTNCWFHTSLTFPFITPCFQKTMPLALVC